jgi:hypothetical protein
LFDRVGMVLDGGAFEAYAFDESLGEGGFVGHVD